MSRSAALTVLLLSTATLEALSPVLPSVGAEAGWLALAVWLTLLVRVLWLVVA